MSAIRQRVTLLTHTPDALPLIYAAFRQCYHPGDVADMWPRLLAGEIGRDKQADFVARILASGHDSPIEHVSFTFAVSGVSRALTHQLVRHRIASYCLSGDTVVVAFKAKTRTRAKRWTMKQLYEMSQDQKRKGRLKLIRLRSVNDDGVIVPNAIRSIVYSGEQEVLRVTTKSGRTIKATSKHRFLTKGGYSPLGDMSVGDKVICNGLPAYKNPEWIEHHYLVENNERSVVASMAGVSDACLGFWIRKFGLQKHKSNYPNRKPGHGVKGMFSPEARKCLSDQKKGERNPMWKGDEAHSNAGRLRCIKMYAADRCEACGTTELKIERHHLNGNPLDNSPDNIMALCQKCHKAFHMGQAVLAVFSDEIVSIDHVGIEDTYDIEMEGPWHNFVAEGFVVHNSQQSQRYVDAAGFDYVVPPSIQSAWELYAEAMEAAEHYYRQLIEAGISQEDARFVLPNACETKIVVTMNCRSLLHFFEQRCCLRAQWEIRAMANEMLRLCRAVLPVVFDAAGARCERLGYCPEDEKFSCGKMPRRG